MSGEVCEDDSLRTDVDEGLMEVGHLGARAQEFSGRLLQSAALQHSHLDSDIRPVFGGAGSSDEVIEAMVVDVGGEVVERLAHPQEHADCAGPVVDIAARVEFRLLQHGFGRRDEVGDHPTDAFGHRACGFGFLDGFEVGTEPDGVFDIEGECAESCEFAELSAQDVPAVLAGAEDVVVEAHRGLRGVVAGGQFGEVLHGLVDGDVPRLAPAVQGRDMVGQGRALFVEFGQQAGEVRALGLLCRGDETD